MGSSLRDIRNKRNELLKAIKEAHAMRDEAVAHRAKEDIDFYNNYLTKARYSLAVCEEELIEKRSGLILPVGSITAVLLLLFFVVFTNTGPNISGFAAADSTTATLSGLSEPHYTQYVYVATNANSELKWQVPESYESYELRSLKISGAYEGEAIDVYLETESGDRFLVVTLEQENVIKAEELDTITGNAGILLFDYPNEESPKYDAGSKKNNKDKKNERAEARKDRREKRLVKAKEKAVEKRKERRSKKAEKQEKKGDSSDGKDEERSDNKEKGSKKTAGVSDTGGRRRGRSGKEKLNALVEDKNITADEDSGESFDGTEKLGGEIVEEKTVVDTLLDILTEKTGSEEEKSPQINFKNACEETCSLPPGIISKNYKLVFIGEGKIAIESLNVELGAESSETEVLVVVNDAENIDILTDIELVQSETNDIGEKSNGFKHRAKVKKDKKYDLKVKPESHPIKEIDFHKVNLKNKTEVEVGIDDIPEFGGFVDVYAIDPTNVDFEDATVTKTATGENLYKCEDWDFETRMCEGTWVKIQDITPGEDYDFELTPDDPGFAEGPPETAAPISVICYREGSEESSCPEGPTPTWLISDCQRYTCPSHNMRVGCEDNYIEFEFGDQGVTTDEIVTEASVTFEYHHEFLEFNNEDLYCFDGANWEKIADVPVAFGYDRTTEFDITEAGCYNTPARANNIKLRFCRAGGQSGDTFFDTAFVDVQTTSSTDTQPPASVTNLTSTAVGTDWAHWRWANPTDSDFNGTVVYIDGIKVALLNSSVTSYNATGLTSILSHTIKIHTVDLVGNVNTTDITDTVTTLSLPDLTAPGKVLGLRAERTGTTWIEWSWMNPADEDFDKAILYLDDVNVANTSAETYKSTGLSPDTSYHLTIKTIDTSGNINDTYVGYTASTLVDAGGGQGNGNGDWDGDGVNDTEDNIIGEKSAVETTGVANLDVRVGGTSYYTTVENEADVEFLDGDKPLITFKHNFSYPIDMRLIKVKKSSTSLVVNLGGQLLDGETKTIYIEDNGFKDLCVKDADITSVDEISSDCTGEKEYDFTSCLGSGTTVTIDSVHCFDEGEIIWFKGLEHSGVRGKQDPDASDDTGGGGSSSSEGSSGGGTTFTITTTEDITLDTTNPNCEENWMCGDWGTCLSIGIQSRSCIDDNACGTAETKPDVEKECGYNHCADGVQNGDEKGVDCGGSCGACTKASGASILLNPEKGPNPLFAIPSMLLLVTLIAIISLRHSKMNHKTVKLLAFAHILLILLISGLLLASFTSIGQTLGSLSSSSVAEFASSPKALSIIGVVLSSAIILLFYFLLKQREKKLAHARKKKGR